jgi:predicted AAA+ superfamily ATPase
MVDRLLKLNTSNSLFLFGARGTGKSTLLRQRFTDAAALLWIDLLSDEDEDEYRRHPSRLSEKLATTAFKTVVIDEVQKNPKLLDIVQLEIEKNKDVQFILSSSSARKLKRGSANLLGGRAFTFNLFPMTHMEIGERFNLLQALEIGTLPKLLHYSDATDITRYLKSYVKTYLREEIVAEQVIRKIEPFQDFLEVSAQMNGKIINFSKIANEVGVDEKTIKTYYDILVDTLIGFYLPPFHRSIRKRQREAPKFYLFDPGIKRALANTLNIRLDPKTFEFGNAFEHFIILEVFRLNSYLEHDYKLSYLRTKDDAEIDLIVERPGHPDLLIEIKSYDRVQESDTRALQAFVDSWDRPAEGLLLSRDPSHIMSHDIKCYPWDRGLREIMG